MNCNCISIAPLCLEITDFLNVLSLFADKIVTTKSEYQTSEWSFYNHFDLAGYGGIIIIYFHFKSDLPEYRLQSRN